MLLKLRRPNQYWVHSQRRAAPIFQERFHGSLLFQLDRILRPLWGRLPHGLAAVRGRQHGGHSLHRTAVPAAPGFPVLPLVLPCALASVARPTLGVRVRLRGIGTGALALAATLVLPVGFSGLQHARLDRPAKEGLAVQVLGRIARIVFKAEGDDHLLHIHLFTRQVRRFLASFLFSPSIQNLLRGLTVDRQNPPVDIHDLIHLTCRQCLGDRCDGDLQLRAVA
mmetsp:Transcript_116204/g.266748  ORF Transcript_116204/g.266748 Transcript_116204/m.266748 type:complete len:224 (-) Transcript_116204:907-1578(-)